MIQLEDLRKVSGKELLFYIFFVSGGACPGVLAIWLFNPKMIETCSVPMLMLLSISLTLPIVALNSLAAAYVACHSHEEKDFPNALPPCVGVGSLMAIISIGVPLTLSFLFGFSLKTFVEIAGAIEIVCVGLCFLVGLSMYKPPKK